MNEGRPNSAIPPVAARGIAFAAILAAGFFGGLIGYFLATAGATTPSGVAVGVALFVGSVAAASGTAVVAVLALRAMGEWSRS